MSKLYRIGFDIGVASVGWCALENDPITEEPTKILKLGVRTFSANEVDKTGESTAKNRREKRGLHRRTRRKQFRMLRAKKLLFQTFGINLETELNKLFNTDVYMLRSKALDEKVTETELSKIILNILKRRGFKSNRKSLVANKDEGKLLKAISENDKFMQEKGYRTIGEAFYKDEKFKDFSNGKAFYNVRNHGGDYKNCVSREHLRTELLTILKKQQTYNKKITDEFISKVEAIFMSQRNFDEGPGKPSPYSANYEIGECTFLKGEQRAPKASYTFEYFNALSKINSLKINDVPISKEQKQILISNVQEKEGLTFAQLRKMLLVPYDKIFNLCNYRARKKQKLEGKTEQEIIGIYEKTTFVSLKNSYSIKKALHLDSSYKNRETLDQAAHLLSTCKSDAKIDASINNYNNLVQLSDEQKQALKQLNFDKFGSLSIKAMEKILPYLEEGLRYDEACKSAGFNHSSFEEEKMKYLNGPKIIESLNDITSPVVKRAVRQTLRVLNELIKEYGSPQMVNIELARELSKDHSSRKELQDRQAENAIKNEQAKQVLADEFKFKASYTDVLKKKLYDEQDGKCMYSGKPLDLNRVFNDNNYVQIDHILPLSRSFDDSYNNKVLVLSSENQNKGNKTPYEYFGDDFNKWNAFVAQVELLQNRKKKINLLKTNFGEDQEKEFIARNLNDTQYMARFMLNLMQKYLLMTPCKNHKVVIRSVNGAITSYLRKVWGINKIRDDGDIHHCIDAAIIATVSNGTIQKITAYNKLKERYIFDEKYRKYIDKQYGTVIDEDQYSKLEKMGMDMLSKRLPAPYPEFIKELELRAKVEYKEFSYGDAEKLEMAKIGYQDDEIDSAKPVFISRMKTVKATGAIHQETIMSIREYEQTKNLIKSVDITKLKLSQKAEPINIKGDKFPEFSIENYYRPQDDRLLYLKIKEYLADNGKIPDNVQFHKPKSDGTDGPVVKKVKMYEKANNIVKLKNGAATNDRMYRVDVFTKNNKYYLCPVYYKDVYAKKLPNKLIARGKDWLDIDDTYQFKFSLYQNDLILITSNKKMVMSKAIKNSPLSQKADKIESNKFLVYYNGTGISTASITIKSHDNCYKIDNLGVQNLQNIEKMYVDVLGNVYRAPQEQRKEL